MIHLYKKKYNKTKSCFLKPIASWTWNKISILPAIFKQNIPTDCPMINELQLN